MQIGLGKWKNRRGECVEIVSHFESFRPCPWVDSENFTYMDNGIFYSDGRESEYDLIAPWEEAPAEEKNLAFWMVYSPQGTAPKKTHLSKEEAIKEATRLSGKFTNQKFYVLEAISKHYAKVECVEVKI